MPFGNASFAVGGHRGCGENLYRVAGRSPGQKPVTGIRENTIKSFLKSVSHKVDFIEFDVQVTKDGVPVIFHDDFVVHGSLCTPYRSLVSQLTLQDFQQLGPLMRWFKQADTKQLLTFDTPWECDEDDAMPTLADVFNHVPHSVGFNIELKMATSAALPATPLHEVRRIVDAVLPVVQALRASRQVVISSFDPDVMQYLADVVPTCCTADLPLWFLSTGGHSFHADPRRMSLRAAIEFARGARMRGIVVDSTMLRKEQDVVREAAASGLKVMTYGLENDDLEWVLQQKALGVVGGIIDNVASVVSQLHEREKMQEVSNRLVEIVPAKSMSLPAPMAVSVQ